MFGMDELILIFCSRPPDIKHLPHFRFCFKNTTREWDDEDTLTGKYPEYFDNKCIPSRVKIFLSTGITIMIMWEEAIGFYDQIFNDF